jgi:hypothetical protein
MAGVAVSATVSKVQDTLVYRYSLQNLSANPSDRVSEFSVRYQAVLFQAPMPAQTISPLGWAGGFFTDDSVYSWWSRDSVTTISRGAILSGFTFKSFGLPYITASYSWYYVEPDSGEPEGEPMSVYVAAMVMETIAPKAAPFPFDAIVFLDTIKSYIDQSCALGWISNQPTGDKYAGYFSSARAKLVQGDSVGARTPLQQVLRDVDIDSSSTLTSEAYALLRYNTDYLLRQLFAR